MIRTYTTTRLTAPKRKRYALTTFGGVDTRVAEENLPARTSPKSYNFSLGKGVLETGYGVGGAYVSKNGTSYRIKKRSGMPRFSKCYRYTMHSLTDRSEKLVCYGEDGVLYDLTLSAQYPIFGTIGNYGKVLCAAPYVYENKDGLLFSSDSGLYFLRDYAVTRLAFSEIFTSMCVHNDRVYATRFLDEYKLCFSDDFDPSNWSVSLREGGDVTFDTSMGKIIELKSFGGNLYVFFEHGIARMTAYNDQSEFRIAKLYLSVGTIHKGTIADCGDRICFRSSDGVYSFDGVSVTKILGEIEDLFAEDRGTSHAVYHGGKYYLACDLAMDSTISGPNSLVIYDLWRRSFEIAHDLKITAMVPVDLDSISGVLADLAYPEEYFGRIDRVGVCGATPTSKLWVSPILTPGSEADKRLLREIRVRSDHAATLRLELDGVSYDYPLVEGLNKVRIMRAFDRMRVCFLSAAAQARITEAEITMDQFGE